MRTQYVYTSQKELRRAFWQLCDELGINTNGKRTKFNLDLNIMFGDWKDSLCKGGEISQRLYDRACLY